MNKIYVGNLSFKINEQDLENLFGKYGEITDIALIRDRNTNRLKGFGFITFEHEESAKNALEKNGEEFLGRPLRVSIAEERRKSGGDRKRDWQ